MANTKAPKGTKAGTKVTFADGSTGYVTEGGQYRIDSGPNKGKLWGGAVPGAAGGAAAGGTGEQIAQTAFNTPDAIENTTPSSLSPQGQAYLAKSRADLDQQVRDSGLPQASADAEYQRRAQQMAAMSPAMQKVAWEVQSQVGPGGINQAQADQEIYQQSTRENATQPNTNTSLTEKSTTADVQNQIADSAKASAMAGNQLTNPNQVNDFGSSNVTIDPITGQPTVTQKLSGENKNVLSGIQGTSVKASDVAQGLLGNQYGQFVEGAGPQSGYSDPRLEQAVYGRLTRDFGDRFGREEEQLQQTLAQRGIPVGSQAYTNAMHDFRTSRDTAYENAQANAVQQGTATALTRQQNNVGALSALNQGVQTTADVGQAGFYQPNFQGFNSVAYQQPDVQGLYNTKSAEQLAREKMASDEAQQKIAANAALGVAGINAKAAAAAASAGGGEEDSGAFNSRS